MIELGWLDAVIWAIVTAALLSCAVLLAWLVLWMVGNYRGSDKET